MTAFRRTLLVLAFAATVSGCVSPGSTVPSAVVTSPRMKVIPAARVQDAIVIGKSTKADVAAALGETLVISFETGYDIWVYRLARKPRGSEFVILFSPSGIATKTRVRHAPRTLARNSATAAPGEL